MRLGLNNYFKYEMNRMIELELFNDGDSILTAIYSEPNFIITDRYFVPIVILNKYDLYALVNGFFTIKDFSGRIFNFQKLPTNMRPGDKEFKLFLNLPEHNIISVN